ncbi:MAG: HAD family phosphatase [Pseudomonadota bacterium]
MMDTSLVIFDCDGVLIDSEAIYLEIERAFLQAKGVDVDPAWYVGEFMALAQPLWRQKLSDLLLEHTGSPLTDDDYADLKAESRLRVMNEVRQIKGVVDLLRPMNCPKCVASSTQMQFLPAKLEHTGLAVFFGDGVYSGDMVENGKPAPDLFLHAAEQMGGHQPSRCIVVEDSANGVRGGKSAGMFTIGFLGGGHAIGNHGHTLRDAGADIVVEDHEALLVWLKANTQTIAA